jgi:hypothetical protein
MSPCIVIKLDAVVTPGEVCWVTRCSCFNWPESVLQQTVSDSQAGTVSSQYASCYPGTAHWAVCWRSVPGLLPRTAACLPGPPERLSYHHLSEKTACLRHMSENWVLCVHGGRLGRTVGHKMNHWRNLHFAGHWLLSECEVRPEW